MSRFFTDELAALSPYTPGEQPKERKYIKLNTNESPFPPSPKAVEALTRAEIESLRLYSDPTCMSVCEAVAKRNGLRPEQVMAGNGSDENLAFALRAFCGRQKGVAFPDITYGFYPVWAKLFDIPAQEIPLAADFSLRVEDYVGLGRTIVIANPNAPTGKVLSPAQIETILRGNPDNVVIVDEAYVDFGAESCVPLISRYENLLVVQTFSKSRSLAGARLGFAMGSAELIADLNRVKFSLNPYNVNRLTLLLGAASMADEGYFAACTKKIQETREWTAQELARLGFELTDSKANFVFARTLKMPGKQVYEQLRERGILVRRWDSPRIADWLRISIGTMEDMQALAGAMTEILEG